jgi:copper chaperone CopZ
MSNDQTTATTEQTVTLTIGGMTCGACERHVGVALAAVPGVAEVAVNRLDGTARVVVTGHPDTAAFIAAVRNAGYEASVAARDIGAAGPASKEQAGSCCGCCEVRA